MKVHARFRFILKSNINTENGDARICLNERPSCTIAANFLQILAPVHTWRFKVSCFEVLDANRVRFKLKNRHSCCEVRIRNCQFENRDLAHAQTFCTRVELGNASLLTPNTDVTINVPRTGKAVTLINLSLTEPETVFRVFNELFLLMCIPSLDKFFRNPEMGKLKEIMGFIVNNGPSEAPSNLLVQMLLVHLLNFLDLDKITQRSFAEYLSKRNFVEHVHTIENKVLSDHGPFSSHCVHKTASPESKEHSENMEYMAKEVINCISKGIFNKQPIECFQGIGSNKNFIFGNEDGLKLFSLLSDKQRKEDETMYQPAKGEILSYLENVWCVKKKFKGTYGEDYITLTSSRTACTDNYSASIFRADECWRGWKSLERFDCQPLPDFKLWEKTGELHYMSFEEWPDFPVGTWDECPGLFLPEKVLELCYRVLPSASKETMMSIAFLAWVSPDEASGYFSSMHKKWHAQMEDDMKKEKWKQHPWYKEKKETLVKMCNSSGIFPTGKKT